MKHRSSMIFLALTVASSVAFAAESPQTAKPTTATMDHGSMAMDHGKMQHGATPNAFDALDANKDGTLSKGELAKHPKAAMFGMSDANRDGRLDKAEFAALEKM